MLGVVFGLVFCALPVVAQGSQSLQPSTTKNGAAANREIRFAVASIRPVNETHFAFKIGPTPNGFDSKLSVHDYIKIAYSNEKPRVTIGHGSAVEIQKLPDWAMNRYAINARVADEDLTAWQNQGVECPLLKSALRNLLEDRFKLVLHEQKTEKPIYNLVVAKKGAKLKATVFNATNLPAGGIKLASGGMMVHNPRNDGRTEWHFNYATMDDLAGFLGGIELPVHNLTNLSGRYDFVLLGPAEGAEDREHPINNWPIDHLGIELKPGKTEGINLVVDHIEKPSEN